ncbi:MAG: hypothetical protein Q4C30_07010 [Bacteroidia bacterium]|nr:hypothetical protein [Bacteroidia bacterium]
MPTENNIADNEKYIAVASYITPAGWIVACLLKWISDVKTPFCIFHLKQGLGQSLLFGLIWVCVSYFDIYLINELIKISYIVLQTIGVLNALNNKRRYLPLFGKLYNRCITFIN